LAAAAAAGLGVPLAWALLRRCMADPAGGGQSCENGALGSLHYREQEEEERHASRAAAAAENGTMGANEGERPRSLLKRALVGANLEKKRALV